MNKNYKGGKILKNTKDKSIKMKSKARVYKTATLIYTIETEVDTRKHENNEKMFRYRILLK